MVAPDVAYVTFYSLNPLYLINAFTIVCLIFFFETKTCSQICYYFKDSLFTFSKLQSLCRYHI